MIELENNGKRIYIHTVNQYGEVQFEVLPKVKEAVDIFKRKSIRRVLDLGCENNH